MSMTSSESLAYIMANRDILNDDELAELDRLIADIGVPIWEALQGPQVLALVSDADVVGYGGAAGGGKTDLILGKALTRHKRIGIFRVNGTEHEACIDRLEEILGSRDGFNSQKNIWRHAGPRDVQIEFLSIPNMGDEQKHRGRPHDLAAFDEASEMSEFQVRFLCGWVRTTNPKQKCQVLLTFNPPSTAEGRWIIEFFAPWLDPKYPKPAKPGELRWFAMMDGREKEVADATPFTHNGELITPQSRTFIPAKVSDNRYLMGSNYMTQLQSLPEPLRSQLLYGDFQAGVSDDAMQVIPTAWVDAAMARWVDQSPKGEMMSVGIDVSRGGEDDTIIARRHRHQGRPTAPANWFDKALTYPGSETRTEGGPKVCGWTIAATRNNAPQHIDVIGVGASPYDFLVQANQQVIGVNCAETATGTDKSGMLRFSNQRTQDWWRMREELDPANDTGIMLPPDKVLAGELCAPKWRVKGKVIEVESRDEIIKRIKRSPDRASAYILALRDTPKFNYINEVMRKNNGMEGRDHDPYASFSHDPYANLNG